MYAFLIEIKGILAYSHVLVGMLHLTLYLENAVV